MEVELLYQSRGNWISLTIKYFSEEDVAKASPRFLPSIREKFSEQMKSICQKGMGGFAYSICCQIQDAARCERTNVYILMSRAFLCFRKTQPSTCQEMYNKFGKRLPLKSEDFLQINCWFNHKTSSATRPSCLGKITENGLGLIYGIRLIKFISDSFPEISQPLIRNIASLVQHKWQKFAVYLERSGLSKPQYKEKSDENLVRAMMVIEDWVLEYGRDATVSVLIEACRECGIHSDNIKAVCSKT